MRTLAASGRLEVRVVPGASRAAVAVEDDTVQIRVTAPPAGGAANEAVIALLAAALDLPRRNLTLIRGATARIKLIGIIFD